MRDLATIRPTLFTRVDDSMKGSGMIQGVLKRPGPVPHLSHSEVITLALHQELIGEPREDHLFRLHQASLRPFFPGLNETQSLQSPQAGPLVGDVSCARELAAGVRCARAGRDGSS